MTTCRTRYFDVLEYQPDAVIRFPAGLPGFDDERQFILIEQPPHRPLLFLQSLSDPDLCFTLLPVLVLSPDYTLKMSPEDVDLIGLDPARQPRIGRDVFCGALLAVQENEVTANLMAPLIINLASRIAVQAIQMEPDYSHCYRVATPEMVVAC
jgi:flagellar assembly factor FliW